MEEENSVSFSSPEEEIDYWKEKALEYRTKYVQSPLFCCTDLVCVYPAWKKFEENLMTFKKAVGN